MLGRWPSSNSASKVEPITWAIRPVLVAVAMLGESLEVGCLVRTGNAKTLWPNPVCRSSGESGGRADDVGQLTGNLGLPGPVILPGQRLDEVIGILGRSPHGHHPGNLLADGRVQEALEQPHLERDRDDLFEDT